jgi:fatty acid desaturase
VAVWALAARVCDRWVADRAVMLYCAFIGAAAKLPRAIYWPVLVLSAAGLVFVTGVWPHHFTGAAPWPAP